MVGCNVSSCFVGLQATLGLGGGEGQFVLKKMPKKHAFKRNTEKVGKEDTILCQE